MFAGFLVFVVNIAGTLVSARVSRRQLATSRLIIAETAGFE